ncbi:hypothetical protein NM208_g79 [Fusarium decemcellulare]|uniref:Uncharacterized protein n=2 Tax=Fusarium decemcellulare TaxID=57161 RepID=A0ACC1T0Z0_9HYPO|nr:hypothetical protein NM208_g637 [Fusarium decemcellulare]KAJ3550262.1 hypothetical protein NM208_g79 [Fusarium decemcellulare]
MPQRSYYNYDPSLAAAIIFIIIFAISSILHLYQIIKTRTWFFIPFLLGSLFETVGFIGRAIGAEESPNWTFGPYVMQTLLLLLGPTLYAASVYMMLGRLIRLLGAEKHSLIRPSWLTKFFLFGDIVSIALQGIGGGKLVNAETRDDRESGERIIIGGLTVQLLFFGLFMVVTGLLHFRITRNPTATRISSVQVNWKRFLIIIYIASALILIRSLFRMIEYIMGHDSVLQSQEVYIYVFDAALMAAATVMLNIFHPSEYLNTERKPIDDNDSEVEMGLQNNLR